MIELEILDFVKTNGVQVDMEKVYEDYVNDHEFIWGITMNSEAKTANLFSMNDIDIIYDKDQEKYFLGIETLYQFDSLEKEQLYIKYLFNGMTDFMKKNDYDTEVKTSIGYSIATGFDNIEELYASFRNHANGYFAQ